MESPAVDVIIPAYNSGRFLREAIDSALAQDGIALRVIVIDDGSTDNTAELARSFGPRVTVLSQENRGCANARNSGMAVSTAPYIAFLDADDVWRPGKLARQIAVLSKHPSVGLVFTDMTTIQGGQGVFEGNGGVIEDGYLSATKPYSSLTHERLGDNAFLLPPSIAQVITRENFISPSTVMLRRKVIQEVGGFDESFQVCEDAECWLRILRSWRAAAIEDRLVLSRYWGGNLSLQAKKMTLGRLQLGEKVLAHPELFPAGAAKHFVRERSACLYRLGKVALQGGEIKTARQYLLSSLKNRPALAPALLLMTTLVGAKGRSFLLRIKRATGLRLAVRRD